MRRTSALALAGSLFAAAAFSLTGTPAGATPLSDPVPRIHQTGANTDAKKQAIANYWTADRMRAAVPKVVHGMASGKVATGKPVEVKGKPGGGGGTGVVGAVWTGGGNVVNTTGKVFFHEGNSDYVCSGSAVTSTNQSTVTTAGHCVNEGPGAYVTKFSFVPAYDNGNAPYGVWVASALGTTNQWLTAGDFNYDVGMAKVSKALSSATLTQTVGSQGIGFSQPRAEFLYSFGYPAALPYNGRVLDYCSGTAGDDTKGGSQDMRLTCNLTGGSSGGPWFRGFDGGIGTQVSLNSFTYRGEQNAMYGPYFGTDIQTLYNSFSVE